jgi:hypothetical protein
MDGQTARRSRPVATGARLFDQARTTNHSRTKPIGFVTTNALCPRSSPMDSNISSTLTYVVKDAALDQLNVAGSTRFYKTLCKRPLRKLSSSVI